MQHKCLTYLVCIRDPPKKCFKNTHFQATTLYSHSLHIFIYSPNTTDGRARLATTQEPPLGQMHPDMIHAVPGIFAPDFIAFMKIHKDITDMKTLNVSYSVAIYALGGVNDSTLFIRCYSAAVLKYLDQQIKNQYK